MDNWLREACHGAGIDGAENPDAKEMPDTADAGEARDTAPDPDPSLDAGLTDTGGPDTGPTLAERIDDIVHDEMVKQELVGLGVGVVKDGEVVYVQNYGYADRDGQVPATNDTLYRWASISKPLTATALLQLFDDLLRRHLGRESRGPPLGGVPQPDEPAIQRPLHHLPRLPEQGRPGR